MFVLAIHYKLASESCGLRDYNFEWAPTDGEWKNAEKVSKFLEAFFECNKSIFRKLVPYGEFISCVNF
jgi:hypothetical protein